MKHVKKIASLLLAVQGLSGCFAPETAPTQETHASRRALIKYVMPALSASENSLVMPTITNCIDNLTNRQIGKEFCIGLIHPTKNLCAGKSVLQDKDCDPTALKNTMAALEAQYETAGTISWTAFNADQLANKGKVVTVSQADFASGTLRIKQPCKIQFTESVQFNPNRDENALLSDGKLNPNRILDWYPEESQAEYNPSTTDSSLSAGQKAYNKGIKSAYQLGFFAAMTLENDGIIVDLNGKTLSMHPEFATMQQFYAHIELSDRPFAPSNGPVDFGNPLKSAHHVMIKNGTLGSSSHQGIHGNDASDVLISYVHIKDFTVAGVSLNGSKRVQILDSVIESNVVQQVYGGFSELRFDTILAKGYRNYVMATGGGDIFDSASPAYMPELKAAHDAGKLVVENIFDAINLSPTHTLASGVLNTNDDKVLRNKIKLTDAAAYGIVINPAGNATGPLLEQLMSSADSAKQPSDIYIARTNVTALVANPREILTFSNALSSSQINSSNVVSAISGNQRGPTGSTFDFWNILSTTSLTTTGVGGLMTSTASGAYVGNVVSDLQIELAALQNLLPTQAKPMLGTISIDPMIIQMKREAKATPSVTKYRIVPLGSAIPGQESVGNRIFIVVDSSDKSTFPLGAPVSRDGEQIKFASLGNGDVQHHVLKGIFGLRADGVSGLTLVDVSISGVRNRTIQGFSPKANGANIGWTGALDGGHEGQSNMQGFFGNHVRGISVNASENVKLESVSVSNIVSDTGPVWGVDVRNNSDDVRISGLSTSDITATGGLSGSYVKPTFVNGQISPNWSPVAVTLDISSSVTDARLDAAVAGSSTPSSLTLGAWFGLP